MEDNKSMEVFAKAPIRKAVLQNALPAMAAMLMVLIYNLADTFFIGQTHDDLQVAAVSLATPVFLLFMSVGTVFGIGGTSVISRTLGEGRKEYAKLVAELSDLRENYQYHRAFRNSQQHNNVPPLSFLDYPKKGLCYSSSMTSIRSPISQ